MDDILFNSLYELSDLIKDSDEYKRLKYLENVMINDKNFIIFSNEFKNLESEYNFKYRLNLDLKEITKQLSISKSKLYSLDVVKEYNKQYKIVKELLDEIGHNLIKGVIKK